MQARLLEVLHGEVEMAEVWGRDRRVVEHNWNAFTISLEESLGVLSVNTSILTRDLLSALLRLQTFTRDSADVVAHQLSILEGDICGVREQLRQVRIDVDTIGESGVSAVESMIDVSQERLFMVSP